MVYVVANQEALKEYLAVRPGETVFLQTKVVGDPKDYDRRVRVMVGDVAFDGGTLDDDEIDKLMDLLKGRPVIDVKGQVDTAKFFR